MYMGPVAAMEAGEGLGERNGQGEGISHILFGRQIHSIGLTKPLRVQSKYLHSFEEVSLPGSPSNHYLFRLPLLDCFPFYCLFPAPAPFSQMSFPLILIIQTTWQEGGDGRDWRGGTDVSFWSNFFHIDLIVGGEKKRDIVKRLKVSVIIVCNSSIMIRDTSCSYYH